MAEAVKLKVETRDPKKNLGTGSRVSRKLRARGRVPAIIYGHKLTPVPISLAKESIRDMIKNSAHLAELDLGGNTETVLIRDVQWDHLGKEILHVDFARVSAEESIHTQVRVDLKGVAPGIAEGGVLEQMIHSVEVTCRAGSIPESIKVDVSGLRLGQSIHVRELVLPEGVTVNADPDVQVVHVVTRAAEPEPTTDEGPTQPEVIKPERKEKEKEG